MSIPDMCCRVAGLVDGKDGLVCRRPSRRHRAADRYGLDEGVTERFDDGYGVAAALSPGGQVRRKRSAAVYARNQSRSPVHQDVHAMHHTVDSMHQVVLAVHQVVSRINQAGRSIHPVRYRENQAGCRIPQAVYRIDQVVDVMSEAVSIGSAAGSSSNGGGQPGQQDVFPVVHDEASSSPAGDRGPPNLGATWCAASPASPAIRAVAASQRPAACETDIRRGGRL